MDNVFILGGLRSFIGIKNRAYRHVPAECLGAAVLKALVARYQPSKIDMIICGNCVGGGGNMTRLMALEAGLPESIPAFTVDLQCASSLEAVITAATRIQSGLADLIVAGGFESSSTQPLRSYNPNHPSVFSRADRSFGSPDNGDAHREAPSLTYSTAKFIPGVHREDAMLQGAEKTINHYRISRSEMDAWVLESHRRAYRAAREGLLDGLTVSVLGLDHDEGIRPRLNQRLLDRLPCVLKDGRYLNAANVCTMNDGAAFLLLCSESYLRKHELSARFRLENACTVGADPLMSPASVLPAIKGLLERSRLSMDDIGAIECNEAFAAIDVLVNRAYPHRASRYNQLGGALAYGHPYGASGAIVLLHLMRAMELSESSRGICCAAAAGGIGSVVLLER
ncbi:MAG: thiolase family protein [Pyramidobacter sp.]|jgi:acetyl-CoA C-acetyltransferase